MRLRSFVLADSVGITPDGKAMILGGGIGRVQVHRFPWALAQLGAFISVDPDQETPGSEHRLEAQVVDPDNVVLSSASGPFVVPESTELGMPIVNFAPMFFQVQLPRAGRHRVRVLLDAQEVDSFPFDVVVGEPQPDSHWPTAQTGT